ncbi:MBL fold metallo-hydrolase [Alkalibacterium iburiense]|uniref:MBL fold metallo-hydrolase n=1 Tax=Alkalibacterium iburiense TaxID=290589 RepID=A0ABP3H9N2_9LACT
MKLTVLGFYGGYPTNDIGTSSYLLESDGYHLLLDVGSYSLLTLEKHLDPLDLDAVLLSHYHHDHHDHIADLGVLQFTRKLKKDEQGNRPHTLPIYCQDEDSYHYEDMTLDNVSQGIKYNHSESIDIGPFKVSHMKTLHPVPCYAFRIEEKKTGKVLVYTADSGFLEKFIPFSTEADLLVADSNLYKGMENHTVHMTAKECGMIAHKAQVKTLLLSHLPQTGEWEQLLEQARDEAPDTTVLLAEKELELII